MGLLDALRNGIGQKQSAPVRTNTPAPVTKGEPVAKEAPSKSADTFKVKFGNMVPYYDPEYKNLEVTFNGFGEVKSESWAKDPKGSEFVGNIINMTLTREIMNSGSNGVSYKELMKKKITFRNSVIEALREKNIEVISLAINTISLTEESKEAVKLIDQNK